MCRSFPSFTPLHATHHQPHHRGMRLRHGQQKRATGRRFLWLPLLGSAVPFNLGLTVCGFLVYSVVSIEPTSWPLLAGDLTTDSPILLLLPVFPFWGDSKLNSPQASVVVPRKSMPFPLWIPRFVFGAGSLAKVPGYRGCGAVQELPGAGCLPWCHHEPHAARKPNKNRPKAFGVGPIFVPSLPHVLLIWVAKSAVSALSSLVKKGKEGSEGSQLSPEFHLVFSPAKWTTS